MFAILSELCVAAVAHRRGSRVFAAAEEDATVLLGREFNGKYTGILMTTVTDGLIGAHAAGAPDIGLAGVHICGIGRFLRDRRIGHRRLHCLGIVRLNRLEPGSKVS